MSLNTRQILRALCSRVHW